MASLVKQYLENEKKISRLDNELQNFIKAKNDEINRVKWDVYEPKIRALISERDEKIEALRDEQIQKESDVQRRISELNIIRGQVNRILKFLRLQVEMKFKNLTIEDGEVYAYQGRHIESLGYIFNDEFLKIKLFIVENDKPKNKYSLIAVGKCLFPKELLELSYSYGLPTHEDGWYSLKIVIRDMPRIDDLKAYLDRNKETVLTMLTQNYEAVKKDYLDMTQRYRVQDFVDLIQCQCECGYFYTKDEVRNTSRRQEGIRCPLCSKVMGS